MEENLHRFFFFRGYPSVLPEQGRARGASWRKDRHLWPAQERELPACKIGKEWRFTRKNLLAYVGETTPAPNENPDELVRAIENNPAKVVDMLNKGHARVRT